MIDTFDRTMVEWLTEAVGPARVILGPPLPADGDAAVACHLLGVRPEPTARSNRRPPLEATARYLITTSAPDPVEAHRLLGLVLVAAADRADVDIEPTEPELGLWPALGASPRAALVLRARLRWPRPERRAPLVREPVRLQFAEIGALAGIVVSPAGTPVARAEVRVPDVASPVWTRSDGTFVLAGAPAISGPLEVTVTARGQSRMVSVAPPSNPAEPLTVLFDPDDHDPEE